MLNVSFMKGTRGMEEMTVDLLKRGEKLIDLYAKVTGTTFTDMLKNMDAETGAFVGGCMELYVDAKDLAVMQAAAFDDLLGSMEELKKINEKLFKQNEELRKLLQEKK